MYIIFSIEWIKEKARDFMGFGDTIISQVKPGTIKIKSKCKQESKYNDFKNFILENKPIGATVIFENCIWV